jgi:hypothetical protein
VTTGRLAAARAAHATYFAALANQQGALMGEPGRQLDALDRLDADYDNLRAALAYLIEDRHADTAARMARRLIGLFNIRHPAEGLGWFQQVIAIADGLPATTRARLYADTAFAAMNAGNGWRPGPLRPVIDRDRRRRPRHGAGHVVVLAPRARRPRMRGRNRP